MADKDSPSDPDAKPPKKDEIRKAARAQQRTQDEWFAAIKSAGNYAAFLGYGELFGTEYEGPKANIPKTKKERLARALESTRKFASFDIAPEEEN